MFRFCSRALDLFSRFDFFSFRNYGNSNFPASVGCPKPLDQSLPLDELAPAQECLRCLGAIRTQWTTVCLGKSSKHIQTISISSSSAIIFSSLHNYAYGED